MQLHIRRSDRSFLPQKRWSCFYKCRRPTPALWKLCRYSRLSSTTRNGMHNYYGQNNLLQYDSTKYCIYGYNSLPDQFPNYHSNLHSQHHNISSTRNITTKNFSWYTNFNFAYNGNKVLQENIPEQQTTCPPWRWSRRYWTTLRLFLGFGCGIKIVWRRLPWRCRMCW